MEIPGQCVGEFVPLELIQGGLTGNPSCLSHCPSCFGGANQGVLLIVFVSIYFQLNHRTTNPEKNFHSKHLRYSALVDLRHVEFLWDFRGTTQVTALARPLS